MVIHKMMSETNCIEFICELDIEREVVAFPNYHEGGMVYYKNVFSCNSKLFL